MKKDQKREEPQLYLQNINVSWWTFLKPKLRSVFISLKISFQGNLYAYDLIHYLKWK